MNFHENLNENDHYKKSSEKIFGFVMTTFFVLLAVITQRFFYLFIAILLFLISIFIPVILKPLNYLWFYIGKTLHKIFSPIMLGILFFGIFTFFGIIMRIFNKRPLIMKPVPDTKSYWKPSNLGNFEDQF